MDVDKDWYRAPCLHKHGCLNDVLRKLLRICYHVLSHTQYVCCLSSAAKNDHMHRTSTGFELSVCFRICTYIPASMQSQASIGPQAK